MPLGSGPLRKLTAFTLAQRSRLMAKNRPRPSPTSRAQAQIQKTDGNGNGVGNEILLRLPASEYDELFPKLEFVRLNLHTVLHEAGEPIKSAYFVNSGLESVLTVQPDGKSVEVGLIGREGFVGLPIIDGYRSSPLRIIVQGDGNAYRVDAETLIKILPRSPRLQLELHRFGQRLAMQGTQIAACN